jgi:hypothetical protein
VNKTIQNWSEAQDIQIKIHIPFVEIFHFLLILGKEQIEMMVKVAVKEIRFSALEGTSWLGPVAAVLLLSFLAFL